MGLLILGIVVLGFGQSYFLAGMLRAKLPNTLVHIHGALYVSWIFLVTIQPWLVANSRVNWHMRLGVLAVILLPLMAVFGVLIVFDFIRRDDGSGISPQLLMAGDFIELALFVGLTIWGLLVRRSAASHKRLMTLGTMAILGPAIARWPIPFNPLGIISIQLALPLLVVLYDLWSSRRVHRITTIAYAMIVVGLLAALPVSNLGFWQPIIAWVHQS
jgi:hypothetical protein